MSCTLPWVEPSRCQNGCSYGNVKPLTLQGICANSCFHFLWDAKPETKILPQKTLSQTGGAAHWPVAFRPLHVGIYRILDKHGEQRTKVHGRIIQMIFPMIQMANNDSPVQSACLFCDNDPENWMTQVLSQSSRSRELCARPMLAIMKRKTQKSRTPKIL